VKFVLHIQLELQSYSDRVAFTVSPIIGHLGFVTDVVICNYSILVKHRKSMSRLTIAVVDNFGYHSSKHKSVNSRVFASNLFVNK